MTLRGGAMPVTTAGPSELCLFWSDRRRFCIRTRKSEWVVNGEGGGVECGVGGERKRRNE